MIVTQSLQQTQRLIGDHVVVDGGGALVDDGGASKLRVLVACEYSAIVRDAFRARGFDAWSCDLLPTDGDPRWHIQGDILDHLNDGWDLMIAHPTCTFATNSGVCHLHKDASRWPRLFESMAFMRKLLEAPIPHIALENPIMHKYARQLLGGRKPDQYVQPWMFGHTEQKATGLMLKGLPKLVPTDDVKAQMMALPDNERQRLHYLPPGPDRWKERSRTFTGIAAAMAEQWGNFLNSARNSGSDSAEPIPAQDLSGQRITVAAATQISGDAPYGSPCIIIFHSTEIAQ